MLSFRSACQDVSPEFQFMCIHPEPHTHIHTHTELSLANIGCMLTLAHNLSISSSQACLTERRHWSGAAVKVMQDSIED